MVRKWCFLHRINPTIPLSPDCKTQWRARFRGCVKKGKLAYNTIPHFWNTHG